jgi:ferric iron reductase protein FhuF
MNGNYILFVFQNFSYANTYNNMNLDIIISGSRFGKERKIIIEKLRQYTQANVYDCNEYATDIIRESKQNEINNFIRHCDWYILVASTDTYGRYTFEEWETITECMKKKSREQVVTIIRCSNVSESVKKQNVEEKGEYSFTDFRKRLSDLGFSENNFYVTYTYDKDFRSLEEAITNELTIVLNKNLVLRKYSTPLDNITAKDVFIKNPYRTEESNGFIENVYLHRSGIDDELDQNNNFVIVIGAPASGKTRAVYEYLKRKKAKKPKARMLFVDNQNLEEVVKCLKNYQKWHHTLIDGETQDLSDYYFVCDQVNDMLYTETNIGLFAQLYQIAVQQFNAHLLCTALTESFQFMIENSKWKQEFQSNPYTEVVIRKLQEESAEFVHELEELMPDHDSPLATLRKKEVIGDYIKGLVDYNESIKKAVSEYSDFKAVKNFVKAYHTIRILRKGTIVPLGLVVAVFEKISNKEFDTEYINTLLAFFNRYNILSIYSTKYAFRLPLISSELFEYDNEKLRMRYPANYLIQIENDYIWNILYEQYAYDVNKPDDMEQCISVYSDAFLKEAPLSTLRRIIARSPSVMLSVVYGAHPDNVRCFVMERLKEVCKDEQLWENHSQEICILIAHVLNRSKSLEEFQKDFDEWTKNRFQLTENVVAELMGFGFRRSFIIKKQVKEFLSSKGWDFNAYNGISFYYHSRMIQYLQSFEEVKNYMEEKVLIPTVLEKQYEESDLTEVNKQSILRSLLAFCQDKDQLIYVLEWTKQMQVRIDRTMIYNLCEVVKKAPQLQFPQENAIVLNELNHFFNQIPIIDISQELLCYYMTDMACCFQNALIWYQKGESLLEQIPTLKKRTISSILRRSRPDEFSLIYRYFFKNGKLKKDLPQISRNLLLKRMNVSDGIALLELLFNQKNVDSTPDVNTIISLLTDLKSSEYAYQSLLQILKHPLLQGIHYNESVICMMLQYCSGKTQEDYIVEHFIKPDRYRYLKEKYGQTKNENQLKQEVENDWHNILLYNEKIVTSRIQNRYNQNFEEIETDAFRVIEYLLKQNRAIDPSLLNNTFSKLFYLYEHQKVGKEKFEGYRKKLFDYLEQKVSVQQSSVQTVATNTCRKRIDFFIKDEFFYFTYYRLFPEKAVQLDTTGCYILNEEVMKIPRPFINTKLFSNILQGIIVLMNEKVLRDIEQWFVKNITDFRWDSYAYGKALKWYGRQFTVQTEIDTVPVLDYDTGDNHGIETKEEIKNSIKKRYKNIQASEWQFLADYYARSSQFNKKRSLYKNNKDYSKFIIEFGEEEIHKIEQIKDSCSDSYPNIGLLHKLFKTCTIPSHLALKMVEFIFLKYDLPITSSLWKSVLENIKYRIRYYDEKKGICQEITRLKTLYYNLIFEDTTTLIYQLNIFQKDIKKQEEYFKQIKNSDYFLSIVDYSELIRLPNLYKDDFNQYIDKMTQYRELLKAIYSSPPITETYNHFIVKCVNYYALFKDSIGKEQKMEIIHTLREIIENINKNNTMTLNNNWLANVLCKGTNKEDYLDMLTDLKGLCEIPIEEWTMLVYPLSGR